MATRIWDLVPRLFNAMRASHEEVKLFGAHDFVHAARVGEMAMRVALDEWHSESIALVAGAAGLCHNADRIIQKSRGIGHGQVSTRDINLLVSSWLNREPDLFGNSSMAGGVKRDSAAAGRRYQVINAVLNHSEKNNPGDSQVLIALKDGDRVVNLDIDHFARCGQHYHDIPVVDYKNWLSDPEATYFSPRSVLKDAAHAHEWADPRTDVCVRTNLGKKLALERVDAYLKLFAALEKQLEAEGIRPYPFER